MQQKRFAGRACPANMAGLWVLLGGLLGCLACSAQPGAATASSGEGSSAVAGPQGMRYVVASSLNLRAEPSAQAPVQARLRINQPVRLLGSAGRWCEVSFALPTSSPAGEPLAASAGQGEVSGALTAAQRGHVDCGFLGTSQVTLAQIETALADALLALVRQSPPPNAQTSDQRDNVWLTGLLAKPKEGRQLIEAAFMQLERHFAVTPSLYSVGVAETLLLALQPRLGELQLGEMVEQRSAQWRGLRQSLAKADFSREPREALSRSPLALLNTLLDRRLARAWARAGVQPGRDGVPTGGPSLFRAEGGAWAVGWAGGPLAASQPAQASARSWPYALTFDAYSKTEMAGVLEMVKHHRLPFKLAFPVLPQENNELSQMHPDPDGQRTGLTLEAALPVWGVTDNGLVPGQMRKLGFFGDVCSNAENTRVEFSFSQEIQGSLYAVFASSVPIDPARVRVNVRHSRSLDPLRDMWENTLRSKELVSIDLDGDGRPDLRFFNQQDSAVGQNDSLLRRLVGGWYANDVHRLEVNLDGRWQVLSNYSVVTCT